MAAEVLSAADAQAKGFRWNGQYWLAPDGKPANSAARALGHPEQHNEINNPNQLRINHDSLAKFLAFGALTMAAPFLVGPAASALAGGGGTSAAVGGAASAPGAASGATAAAGGFGRFLPLIGQAGQIAGGMAAGRGQGRMAEADIQQQQDALNLSREREEQARYQDARREAIVARLLQGTTDVNIQAPAGIPMSHVQGGARPSAIVGAGDLGQTLQRNSDTILNAPRNLSPLTPLPQAGGLDRALNIAAPIAAGFGALAPLYPTRPTVAPTGPQPYNPIAMQPRLPRVNYGSGSR